MAQFKIAETINELIAELIGLNNAEPDFDINSEIIVNTINELITELISLTGIESGSSGATSADIIKIIRYKETIEELLTKIVTLKRSGAVTGEISQASATAETVKNLEVIALSITLIIASINVGIVASLERIAELVADPAVTNDHLVSTRPLFLRILIIISARDS